MGTFLISLASRYKAIDPAASVISVTFWMRNKECPRFVAAECPHFVVARGQVGFASANARRRPSATKSAPMLRFIQVTIALL